MTGREFVSRGAFSFEGVNRQEEDNKTALHKAAWNCDHILMQMLLEAGADARAMDINGCSPIQYLLKVTDVRHTASHENCYQLLLNYNAARIYPPQFHKVRGRRSDVKPERESSFFSASPTIVAVSPVLRRSCSPAITTLKLSRSWSTRMNI